jgi:hypothetical protein
MAKVSHDRGTQILGHLTAIHGSVVDVRFAEAALPDINEGIAIERGEGKPLVAEVQQHLDAATVRAVALGNTAGLSRGASARAMGTPIRVPVGDAVLGRLLNAIGEPADRGPAFPAGTDYRPIHSSAPTLDRLGADQARSWFTPSPALSEGSSSGSRPLSAPSSSSSSIGWSSSAPSASTSSTSLRKLIIASTAFSTRRRVLPRNLQPAPTWR